MTSQSLGNPNRDNFETPPWESRDKKPFECGCGGVTQRILYGGRWWLPQVRAMVSLVSPGFPVACPSTKGALKKELTNLLVGLMQVRISKQSLSPIPIPEPQHTPLPLLVLRAGSVPQVPHNFAV
jgi:hypothetical protein